jgi:hypothetical protein
MVARPVNVVGKGMSLIIPNRKLWRYVIATVTMFGALDVVTATGSMMFPCGSADPISSLTTDSTSG